MVFHPAAAIGALVLTAVATEASLATAMIVGGLVCAAAAPLYIPALRAERRRQAASPIEGTSP
jgi:hypothetical protein